MALRVPYGGDDDMMLYVNGVTVTIKKVVFNQEYILEFVNNRDDIELVIAQVTDENHRLVIPDVVDVRDPNLAPFTFGGPFIGTVYVVACRSGAADKLNTTVIAVDPIVKTDEKIWINQYTKTPYKVTAIEIGD